MPKKFSKNLKISCARFMDFNIFPFIKVLENTSLNWFQTGLDRSQPVLIDLVKKNSYQAIFV